MRSSSPSELGTILLALGVIGAAIAIGFVIARTAQRRARRVTRERAQNFQRLLEDYLVSRARSSDVRLASRHVDASAFWGALESLAANLSRSRRIKTARALARSRHCAAERRALRDDSPWRRELAASRLGLIGSAVSRRALHAALDRGPESVRYSAARSLARMRDPHALRWILSNPEALSTRSHAARTAILRAFGRPALPAMAMALENGGLSFSLERAVIETLGVAGYASGGPALERRLDAPDPEIRVAAARALGRIKASDCGESLIRALRDPVWQVRAQAARSLGLIGEARAIESLCECLTDTSWWVRRHAAYALDALGDPGHDSLRRIIATSPDPYARDIAREALAGGIRD